MGSRSFFNALHDREGDLLLATVLEGPAQGERVLLRNTAPVWPEELPAFWGEHLPALAAVTSSGILESAGQRIFVERFGADHKLWGCAKACGLRRRPCGCVGGAAGKTAGSAGHSAGGPPRVCGGAASGRGRCCALPALWGGACADPRRAGDILCGRDPCPQL